MKYIVWDKTDLDGLESFGLSKVLTEIDETGHVVREIGITSEGGVQYKSHRAKPSGMAMFDWALVEIRDQANDLRAEEFENLWEDKRN
jgi:hypothetical protein